MRPPPCLVLIAPPPTGGTEAIIREAGQRQAWQLITLDAPQLDYYNLKPLHPGWLAWENQGRYLSTNTLGFLCWAALSAPQPGLLEA